MRAVLGIGIAAGGVALLAYVLYGVSLSLNPTRPAPEDRDSAPGGDAHTGGGTPPSTGGRQ